MVPPDSFWPGGHTHIRRKLPLLGHKASCCTSTWPSCSFLRGRSHIMAPKLRNIIDFNVSKMSLSVWFTAIKRQLWALSGCEIHVPMFLRFLDFVTDFFVLSNTLRNSFGYCHEKAPKKFFHFTDFCEVHRRWSHKMIRKNASGRENFRVERVRERKKERECPNLLAFQGYYKSSI